MRSKSFVNITAKIPKKDVLIVQGNWNVKAGPDVYKHWAGTMGKFG